MRGDGPSRRTFAAGHRFLDWLGAAESALEIEIFESGGPVLERVAIELTGFLSCSQFLIRFPLTELEPTGPRSIASLDAENGHFVIANRVWMFVNEFRCLRSSARPARSLLQMW